MKLAFVCEDVHKRGGTERVVYEHATRLSRRHEVHIYAATAEDLDASRVTWHRVPVPDLPTVFRVPLFALMSTLQTRKADFDAVIGQGVNTLRGDYMVVHTTNAAKRDVYFERSQYGGVENWPRRLEKRVWYVFAVGAEKLLLKRSTLKIICVSNDTAKEVMDYYQEVERERVSVVFNGVDCDEFHNRGRADDRARLLAQLKLPPTARVILFAGGEWWRKGLSHVIEAITFLPNHYHLIVVGKGPEAEYTVRAAKAGVGRRVHFLGTRRDMPTIYRGADIFVLPSYYEAFSLVVLEGMASGLPVLLSRVNGADDCLRDSYNGYFIEREGRDIAAKIELIFADEARRCDMGRSARATALRFTWERAAETLERTIREGLMRGSR